MEVGNPPERFAAAFALTHDAGLPAVPHAGETAGAESIWGALRSLNAVRIGHGVRCLEDPELVETLRENFSVYKFSNEVTISIKTIVTQVNKTKYFNPNGEPIYIVNKSPVMKIKQKMNRLDAPDKYT